MAIQIFSETDNGVDFCYFCQHRSHGFVFTKVCRFLCHKSYFIICWMICNKPQRRTCFLAINLGDRKSVV